MSLTMTESTKTLKIKVKKILVTDLCEEYLIPYIKCRQTVIKDKKTGENKKVFAKGTVPEKFADWDYAKCEEWNKNIKFQPTHVNILLAKAEQADKFCVIDFDDKDDLEPYLDLFGNDWVSKSSQRQLPHLWRLRKENDYSKCTTKIPINGVKTGIDIKYYNIIERIDSKIEYSNGDYPPLFDFEEFHPKPISEKPQPKVVGEASQQYNIIKNNYVGSRFIKHLQNIDHTQYTNNYADWLKIGFAIKRIFYNDEQPDLWFEILMSYSRLSQNHQSEDTDSWEKMFEGDSKCGIPTLLEYSNKSNDERFIEIENEYYLLKREDANDERSALLNEGYKLLMESVKEFDVIQEPKLKLLNCYVKDDYDACKHVKRLYGDRIVRCSDTWYVNMPGTTYWEQGESFVKQLIMTSNFVKRLLDRPVPYGANTTGCNNIYKALCSSPILFPVNDTFIDEINIKTKGKLFFKDKYWDFIEKAWFPITDVIPLTFIKRNAPTFNFTDDDIDDFTKNVLNMFANDTDRNLFLQATARGLGGFIEDKKFYVMKGLRNSGKGVLQEQCMASFGDLCCTYDVPMSKSNNKGDASDRRWVLAVNAHIKRIGFTNETANIAGKVDLTIDGNELKKVICSGGDIFKARNHYKGEIDVRNNVTTFMFMNDVPKSNPADALENMILFDMPFKFVEKSMKDDDIMYRESDSKIKEKIKTNTKWADIFLYLITKAFKTTQIEFSDMNENNQAETAFVTKEANSSNPIKLFNDAFEKDPNGWVSTDDIKKALSKAKLNDVKFGLFLKDRGFQSKRGKEVVLKDSFGCDMKDENGVLKKIKPTGYAGLSKKTKEEICDD